MKKNKTIVFYESFPTEMIAKLARELRLNGYSTILFYCNEGTAEGNSFLKQAFNQVIALNDSKTRGFKTLPSVVKKIRKINPSIVVYRSFPEITGAALSFLLKKKYLFIYFPYDMIALNRTVGKNGFREKYKYKLEMFCQKYSFAHCDGVLNKMQEDAFNHLRNLENFGKNFKIKAPVMQFLPYCSNDFMVPLKRKKISKKEKHFVYVGSIEESPMTISQLNVLIENKIHIHLYTKSIVRGINDSYNTLKNTSQYSELMKSEYFHLHKSLGPLELIKEISKYDFGIYFGPGKRAENDVANELGTGNKLASYIEAGLPVFCFQGFKFLMSLVKKYDVGMDFSYETRDWTSILNKVDYKKLVRNVEKMRQDFNFKKYLSQFEKFLDIAREYPVKKVAKSL